MLDLARPVHPQGTNLAPDTRRERHRTVEEWTRPVRSPWVGSAGRRRRSHSRAERTSDARRLSRRVHMVRGHPGTLGDPGAGMELQAPCPAHERRLDAPRTCVFGEHLRHLMAVRLAKHWSAQPDEGARLSGRKDAPAHRCGRPDAARVPTARGRLHSRPAFDRPPRVALADVLDLAAREIRHVIEMSSETTGERPEAFRYSSRRPTENLLNNPRFSRGIRELL